MRVQLLRCLGLSVPQLDGVRPRPAGAYMSRMGNRRYLLNHRKHDFETQAVETPLWSRSCRAFVYMAFEEGDVEI